MIGAFSSGKITSGELDQVMSEILSAEEMPCDSSHIPREKLQGIMLEGIRRDEM